MDGVREGSGRSCPPRQMAGPVLSNQCTKVAQQSPLVSGKKCSLVKQPRQLSTARGTDPEQHHRKGLRDGKGRQPLSQAPALEPESPGLAPTVTS